MHHFSSRPRPSSLFNAFSSLTAAALPKQRKRGRTDGRKDGRGMNIAASPSPSLDSVAVSRSVSVSSCEGSNERWVPPPSRLVASRRRVEGAEFSVYSLRLLFMLTRHKKACARGAERRREGRNEGTTEGTTERASASKACKFGNGPFLQSAMAKFCKKNSSGG